MLLVLVCRASLLFRQASPSRLLVPLVSQRRERARFLLLSPLRLCVNVPSTFSSQDPHHYEQGSSSEALGADADALCETLKAAKRYAWLPVTSMAAGSFYNLCCPLPGLKEELRGTIAADATRSAADIECVASGLGRDAAADASGSPLGIECVESGFGN